MNHGKNIPVYELPDKEQVSKYAKTYKDIEKNKSLMPDQKFINKKVSKSKWVQEQNFINDNSG